MLNHPTKANSLYFPFYNERLQNYKDIGKYIDNIQVHTYTHHRNDTIISENPSQNNDTFNFLKSILAYYLIVVSIS